MSQFVSLVLIDSTLKELWKNGLWNILNVLCNYSVDLFTDTNVHVVFPPHYWPWKGGCWMEGWRGGEGEGYQCVTLKMLDRCHFFCCCNLRSPSGSLRTSLAGSGILISRAGGSVGRTASTPWETVEEMLAYIKLFISTFSIHVLHTAPVFWSFTAAFCSFGILCRDSKRSLMCYVARYLNA